MQNSGFFRAKEKHCQPVHIDKLAVSNLKSNLRNSIYTLRFARAHPDFE